VRCLVNGRNPQSQRCVYRNNNTLCVPKLYLYVLCITQLIQITFLHASSEFKFTTKTSLVSDLLLSSSIFKLASRLRLTECPLFVLASELAQRGVHFHCTPTEYWVRHQTPRSSTHSGNYKEYVNLFNA
jgi:hypothetical protein